MNGHQKPRREAAWLPQLNLFAICTLFLVCVLVLAGALVFVGCGSSTASSGGEFATVTDDNGKTVTITEKPMHIVSTSPAVTQILFALGVGERVVGVNQWDTYPPEVQDLPKVADLQVNTEAVIALSPDLVLGAAGQEEELAIVQAAGAPTLVFNPATVEGIYADITTIGKAVGADDKAVDLIESMRATMAEISDAASATGDSPTVFYALDDTLFTCGPGSFVDELLGLASAVNVASAASAGVAEPQAYYQFAPEQLVAADPDIVVLSGFAFTSADSFKSDARFAGLTAVKEGRVFLLDAQYDQLLTLAAPRIVEGFEALAMIIHPELAQAE
jgi:iron complex transport system substrate-binding protein